MTIPEISRAYPDLLLIDGHESALVGLAVVDGVERLVYDAGVVIENLVGQGMSREEAVEFYEFNIEGAYVGERTPVMVHMLEQASGE